MLRYVVLSVIIVLASSEAMAFKLNPCLRVLVYSNGELSADAIRLGNLCPNAPRSLRQAVHEHMTNFAVNKYRGGVAVDPAVIGSARRPRVERFNYMDAPDWPATNPAHSTRALIFGTWWNDDPLMYLGGEGEDFTAGLSAFRKGAARAVAREYLGGTAECSVRADQHLMRSSHFGSLQYLHFMTALEGGSSDARIQDTLDRALKWIEFAYKVATGEPKATDPLSSVHESSLGLPPIWQNLCVKRESVKMYSLFTRIGLPRERRKRDTHDVALGSIFHILQDSFSPAHTCRVPRSGEAGTAAVLSAVHNYKYQTDSAHSRLDLYPAWLIEYAKSGKHTYSNDPIAVGAWLLAAVDAKRHWPEVEAHLRTTIFAKATTDEEKAQRCIGLP